MPKGAFIRDLLRDVDKGQELRDQVIIVLDANKNVWAGEVRKALAQKPIYEVISIKHGPQVPPTCCQQMS